MNAPLFPYSFGLRFITLSLGFVFWTNILSGASPLPSVLHKIGYEPSEELLNLKGPLVCHGNLTAQNLEQQNPSLYCDGGAFCQGGTFCNDTLVCSRDWVNLNGSLACNGNLLCSGSLICSKGPAHPACLPGLGKLPSPALAVLIVFLVVISGVISGLKSTFMSNYPLPSLREERFIIC